MTLSKKYLEVDGNTGFHLIHGSQIQMTFATNKLQLKTLNNLDPSLTLTVPVANTGFMQIPY